MRFVNTRCNCNRKYLENGSDNGQTLFVVLVVQRVHDRCCRDWVSRRSPSPTVVVAQTVRPVRLLLWRGINKYACGDG